MDFELLPSMTNIYELAPLHYINQWILSNDETQKSWNGKQVLIVNEGGIQSSNVPPDMRSVLREYGYWPEIYKLLPNLPMTRAGKFTGKIELHSFEGYLKTIKFIPNIKP